LAWRAGCVHTHLRVAGKISDTAGALFFLAVSMAVAALRDKESFATVLLLHGAAAALGFAGAEGARTWFGRPGGGTLTAGRGKGAAPHAAPQGSGDAAAAKEQATGTGSEPLEGRGDGGKGVRKRRSAKT
jgi:hypothetical protein